MVAGRSPRTSTGQRLRREPGVTTETLDITDDSSIEALAEKLGSVNHVVSTASARGRLAELNRYAVRLSFDTKVIGPRWLSTSLHG